MSCKNALYQHIYVETSSKCVASSLHTMAATADLRSINSEAREQPPDMSPMTVSLKPRSPSPETPFDQRLDTDRRINLANAWDDVIDRKRTGTATSATSESASTFFPSRKGSSNVSNMVVLDEYDENIMTAQRMQTFASAFPARAATARSMVERLETMNMDLTQESGTSGRAFSSSAIKPMNTMAMLRRPSALPEAAQSGKLQWRNVNIFVGNKHDGRQILHNFTGEIASGQLLAVMGGSGAGKSTFLDALSGRSNLNQLTVEGELAINGYKFNITNQELIRSIATYVPQSDVLCPTQTVEEALLFNARLKLASKSEEVRLKRVNYLIDVLHLKTCRNTLIGDEARRGVSGGEKRRCSIAAELLSDADVIFLDEPTSGLDAYTAARTIKTLKQFCLISNKMVIATIHQPAVEVFYLFDHLILLGAGRPCFVSAINNVDEYFADKINPTQNPADVVIYEAQREPRHYAERWANDHDLNPLARLSAQNENDSEWDKYGKLTLNMIRSKEVAITDNNDSALWCIQFWKLMVREVLALYRDLRLSLLRIFQVLFLAAFVGIVFFNISDRPDAKAMFFALSSLTALMYALVTTVSVFPAKKLLFQRESRSGCYVVSSWALSFQIIEIPREALFMALYTVIVVLLSDAQGEVWHFILIFIAANFAGGSIGIMCGAIAKDLKEAALILPVPLVFMIFFSDSVVPLSDFPDFIKPLAQVNPLFLVSRVLLVTEWRDFNPDTDWDRPIEPNEGLCNALSLFDASVDAEDALRQRTEGMNCTEILFEINYGPFGTTTSTMSPTVDPDADLFCQPPSNVTNTMIYNTLNVDPDLFEQWLIQLAIVALTTRVLAVIILWIANREGFSWIRKKFVGCICCLCRLRRRDEQRDQKMLEQHLQTDDIQAIQEQISDHSENGYQGAKEGVNLEMTTKANKQEYQE